MAILVGPHWGQRICTADTGNGISLSMMPPCMVALVARWWRLALLAPSTITLPTAG